MIVRKGSDGFFYVCRIARGRATKGKGKHQDKKYKNKFFITKSLKLKISFPEKMWGKKVRFKIVEVKRKNV